MAVVTWSLFLSFHLFTTSQNTLVGVENSCSFTILILSSRIESECLCNFLIFFAIFVPYFNIDFCQRFVKFLSFILFEIRLKTSSVKYTLRSFFAWSFFSGVLSISVFTINFFFRFVDSAASAMIGLEWRPNLNLNGLCLCIFLEI